MVLGDKVSSRYGCRETLGRRFADLQNEVVSSGAKGRKAELQAHAEGKARA